MVIREIYADDTEIIYESQKVTIMGGISLVLVTVLVLVVAFLVCTLLAYFAGKKAMKKRSDAPQAEASGDGEQE